MAKKKTTKRKKPPMRIVGWAVMHHCENRPYVANGAVWQVFDGRKNAITAAKLWTGSETPKVRRVLIVDGRER